MEWNIIFDTLHKSMGMRKPWKALSPIEQNDCLNALELIQRLDKFAHLSETGTHNSSLSSSLSKENLKFKTILEKTGVDARMISRITAEVEKYCAGQSVGDFLLISRSFIQLIQISNDMERNAHENKTDANVRGRAYGN